MKRLTRPFIRFAPALAIPLTLAALVMTADPVSAQEGVVAKIGDVVITEKELAIAQGDLAEQFAKVPEAARRAAVLNALIDIKVIALEAEKAGMAEGDAFAARMAFLRARTLHNSYFQDKISAAITEEEVKARYDKEVAAVPPQDEVHAAHILVKTKEEAEAIIADLIAGKDFAAIANEKTQDPSGKTNGGDLGFFAAGQMVPEFEKAAFALADGEYTKEPVQTQFGFHVIKRIEARKQQPPAFEAVQAQVRQLVLRERYFEAVKAAKTSAVVEILDPALKAQIEQLQ